MNEEICDSSKSEGRWHKAKGFLGREAVKVVIDNSEKIVYLKDKGGKERVWESFQPINQLASFWMEYNIYGLQ